MSSICLCLGLLWVSSCISASPKHIDVHIIGGQPATQSQFPFAANIWIRVGNAYSICTGSIIASQWVLTAAHCVKNYEEGFLVEAGALSMTEPDLHRVRIESKRYIAHPNYIYDGYKIQNDIGLIHLPTPFVFNEYIQPINISEAEIGDNVKVTALGWGNIDDNRTNEFILNYVDLTTIPNSNCSELFGEENVLDNIVCAMGETNEGACSGDSGGPLIMTFENGSVVQVGVFSYFSGLGCETEEPVGYSRVHSHIDWIRRITSGAAEVKFSVIFVLSLSSGLWLLKLLTP